MASSLFNSSAVGSGMNIMQMIQQFRQFSQSVTPEGAKAQVEQLMKDGKLSQAQFNELGQLANQFAGFLK